MSYIVLARKWRPQCFSELVGQDHVVRALTNALQTGRVHHAFLFTGTRGVGKTTIARIFAKSLNCQLGVSSEPCGKCAICQDISDGRFVDLLEIDAASNTGVDDIRKLIDTAPYKPTRGKYKVYLIDEVHMLSKAAFNALLKTLEEPPDHVKFLLATTDPEKLPITVLSRCLQFNLKRIDAACIEAQLGKVIAAEHIQAEQSALAALSLAADGSMRDALSLLDQAIAYSGNTLDESSVQAMLGSVHRSHIQQLLLALSQRQGNRVLQITETLAAFSPSWEEILDAVALALHQIQCIQLISDSVYAQQAPSEYNKIAEQHSPELMQMWYQMAIHGRKDNALAPTPRTGFEMTLLRMLAFMPAAPTEMLLSSPKNNRTHTTNTLSTCAPVSKQNTNAQTDPISPTDTGPPLEIVKDAQTQPSDHIKKHHADNADAHQAHKSDSTLRPDQISTIAPLPAINTTTIALHDAESWKKVVEAIAQNGQKDVLAINTSFISYAENVLTLGLSGELEHIDSKHAVNSLTKALTPVLGQKPTIHIQHGISHLPTIQEETNQKLTARMDAAKAAFLAYPIVDDLITKRGARVVPQSITPYFK